MTIGHGFGYLIGRRQMRWNQPDL